MSDKRESAIEKLEIQLIENFTEALADPERANAQMLNNARMFWTDLKKIKREEDEEQVSTLSNSMKSLAGILNDEEEPKKD